MVRIWRKVRKILILYCDYPTSSGLSAMEEAIKLLMDGMEHRLWTTSWHMRQLSVLDGCKQEQVGRRKGMPQTKISSFFHPIGFRK